jgi:hypothetical protein
MNSMSEIMVKIKIEELEERCYQETLQGLIAQGRRMDFTNPDV